LLTAGARPCGGRAGLQGITRLRGMG